MNTQEFIEKAQLIHHNIYDYILLNYTSPKDKVRIICRTHGEFLQRPYDHLKGKGCKLCGRKIAAEKQMKKWSDVIADFQRVHQYTYDYSKAIYKGAFESIEIICKLHGSFWQTPDSHYKYGCPKCSGKLVRTTEDFISSSCQIHQDKYDYSKTHYINARTKVEVICRKHGSFWVRPISHTRGIGCPKCSNWKGNTAYTTESFLEKVKQVKFLETYDFSKVNYKNNITKVEVVCNKHGSFFQRPSSLLSGIGCPNCKTSKGELCIKDWLVENNIEFVQQKTFDGLKDKYKLRYDFYIPSNNLLIEYNGIQHYIQNTYRHTREEFLKQKYHDWLKRKYSQNNNIRLIVIKYTDDIKEILENEFHRKS